MTVRHAFSLLLAVFLWVSPRSVEAGIVLSGGGLALAEEGGVIAPGNLAATGTAFAKDLIPDYPDKHTISRLNDQIFGNSNSWIGNSTGTFAGVGFGATPVMVSSIAFGRDNNGEFTDRTLGTYTLQYTTEANPTAATTAWTTIGTLDYGAAGGTNYAFPSKRHRFTFTPVAATGIRLLMPTAGNCVDELEVYAHLVVNTTADELHTPAGSNISLREAVRDCPAGATITFDSALSGQTITLSAAMGGEITIAKSLTLDASSLAAGLTIDGGPGTNRIFSINSGSVSMRGLTLIGGNGGGAVDNGFGGALRVNGALSMTRCTLAGNSASLSGGAIYLSAFAASATLTQCTLTGNSANEGSAIYLVFGSAILTHCTVSGNSGSGGGIFVNEGGLTLRNTIVAGNNPGGIGSDLFLSGFASSATYTRFGANIVESVFEYGSAGVESSGPAASTAAPLLAPLGNYGGPTRTMALLPGSPARNASVGSNITSDQRGFPIVGTPDIGAYETQIGTIASQTIAENTPRAIAFTVGSVGSLSATSDNQSLVPDANLVLGGSGANRTLTVTPASNVTGSLTITLTDASSGETQTFTLTIIPLTVTSLADSGSGSLRQILANAAAVPGANTVTFASALNGQTIVLASEITISDSGGVTIDATSLSAGITIDGGPGTNRLFHISSSQPISMSGLTLTGGGGAGAIDTGKGGAILLSGTLNLNRCTLTGNSASDGGAINMASGTLNLNQCTLSGNNAISDGGAIRHVGTKLSLNHCTLSANSAGARGGAIYVSLNQLFLTNSIVAGNGAPSGGDIQFNPQSAYMLYTRNGANIVQSASLGGGLIQSGPAASTAAPLLAPLGNYGGPNKTMALLPGSPARNAAGVLAPAITTDQRGFPIVGTPDIGAYEAGTLDTNYQAYIWESLPTAGDGTTSDPLHAAAYDYDGDGVDNWNEWIIGSNAATAALGGAPGAISSVLLSRSGANMQATISRRYAGRTYRLQHSDSLLPGSWSNVPGLNSLLGEGSDFWQFPIPTADRRFYRLGIEKP